MARRGWRRLVAPVAAAALLLGACSGDDGASGGPSGTTEPPPPPPADWEAFGFDLANSRFNATERAVTAASVASLEQRWHLEGLTGMSSTPTVAGGTVYFGDWSGNVHAVDAATGEERWATELEGGQVMSSVTVDGDALYVTTNRVLHRLDRATGDVVWTATSSEHPIAISPGSPVVVDGLVLQGTASGELMLALEKYSFRGSMAAFDAETGEERWRLWLTEGDETSGAGVGIWSTPAVDEERGLAYVGTGNTYEPPASRYSNGVVAFDYTTGEVAWTTQFTYPDVWSMGNPGGLDADVGAGPNLWEAGGRDLVGAGDKRGDYYALDRDTGEIVWQTDMTEGSVLGGVIGTGAHGEGRLYIASNVGNAENNGPTGDTQVLALDDASGEVLWRTTLTGAIYAPVTAVPGVVLVATTSATMHALDAATGEELWSHTAPDQVGSGASVVDGTVYWGYGFSLLGRGSGVGGVYAWVPGDDGDGDAGGDGEVAASAGESTYRKSCASCHGLRGQGGVGPSLQGVADRLSLEEHLELVREGRPSSQMPAFGATLTDEEIRQVVAYERDEL